MNVGVVFCQLLDMAPFEALFFLRECVVETAVQPLDHFSFCLSQFSAVHNLANSLILDHVHPGFWLGVQQLESTYNNPHASSFGEEDIFCGRSFGLQMIFSPI
jgi:hypothetical protein